MEALILSCGTGGGHNSAGRAVAEELQGREHRVTFMDPYQLAGQRTSFLIDNAYIRLVQKSPKAFGVLYALGEMYRHLPFHSPVYCANKKMADCTRRFLDEHHFDVIIMSHMYPAHILTHLKNQGTALPQTVLIATDYTCIPFMEEAVCDYYVIPAEDLREEFGSRGIPPSKILPFGIPVSKDFSKAASKSEIKQRLGLNMNGSHILLSGGSIGAGKIEETTYVLRRYLEQNSDASLTVICGNNTKLFQSLQTTFAHQPQVRLLQNTERMADYMHACDVFISKPGGFLPQKRLLREYR